jgi:hypothetical protein
LENEHFFHFFAIKLGLSIISELFSHVTVFTITSLTSKIGNKEKQSLVGLTQGFERI